MQQEYQQASSHTVLLEHDRLRHLALERLYNESSSKEGPLVHETEARPEELRTGHRRVLLEQHEPRRSVTLRTRDDLGSLEQR